jgi:hypothetical protein
MMNESAIGQNNCGEWIWFVRLSWVRGFFTRSAGLRVDPLLKLAMRERWKPSAQQALKIPQRLLA